MALDRYTKVVLTVIALMLTGILFRPAVRPPVVSAASGDPTFFYVEPGITTLRSPDGYQQVEGKVMIDMRNGNIWGFPTLSGAPYPVDLTTKEPPVSAPMYLGKYDLSKAQQR
jgi:hypothetical protein